ncbi:hypothetical protein LXL04_028026 [Taraxacum kok-saghyz]
MVSLKKRMPSRFTTTKFGIEIGKLNPKSPIAMIIANPQDHRFHRNGRLLHSRRFLLVDSFSPIPSSSNGKFTYMKRQKFSPIPSHRFLQVLTYPTGTVSLILAIVWFVSFGKESRHSQTLCFNLLIILTIAVDYCYARGHQKHSASIAFLLGFWYRFNLTVQRQVSICYKNKSWNFYPKIDATCPELVGGCGVKKKLLVVDVNGRLLMLWHSHVKNLKHTPFYSIKQTQYYQGQKQDQCLCTDTGFRTVENVNKLLNYIFRHRFGDLTLGGEVQQEKIEPVFNDKSNRVKVCFQRLRCKIVGRINTIARLNAKLNRGVDGEAMTQEQVLVLHGVNIGALLTLVAQGIENERTGLAETSTKGKLGASPVALPPERASFSKPSTATSRLAKHSLTVSTYHHSLRVAEYSCSVQTNIKSVHNVD